ncbi:MAG: FCD domain-containing protein [Microcella sp.]|uniref:FadR/GntR family transcriptional regulator n=1 Tax=Microcella sp. TaxID=1913979 RepID=UPI003315F21E
MAEEKDGLRRESLVEQLAERLLDLIIEQRWDEGASLPSTAELSSRFGVSVIVVREAIAILVGRGIVRRQQGREPLIRRPGSEVLESLFRVRASQDGISAVEIQQCRSSLELQAAALAATSADSGRRRAVLEPLIDAMAKAEGVDQLTAADQAFHEGIIELSGNRALGLIIGAVRSAVLNGVDENWHRWFEVHTDGSPGPAIARHQAIADAIIDGDREKAIRAMADHFLEWEEYVDFGQVSVLGTPSRDLIGFSKSP